MIKTKSKESPNLLVLKDVPEMETGNYCDIISEIAAEEIKFRVDISDGQAVLTGHEGTCLNSEIINLIDAEFRVMESCDMRFTNPGEGEFSMLMMSNSSATLFFISSFELIERYQTHLT